MTNSAVGVEYLQLSAFLLKEAVLLLLVHVTACQPVMLLLQSLQLTCQLHNLQHIFCLRPLMFGSSMRGWLLAERDLGGGRGRGEELLAGARVLSGVQKIEEMR